jgi:hypothetical protein
MTDIKNVALVGASGNLGPSILDAFLKNGNFNITVISRPESKATFPSSVKVLKIDQTDSNALTDAFKGQDAAVVTVGAGQLADQQRYIDAAIAAGVKRFVPSEFGSDLSDPEINKLVPIFQPKLETAKYLKSKESDTFSWTSFTTGPFFDWGLQVGFLGFDLANKKARIWDDGDVPFSSSNLSLIGQAVAAALSSDYVADTKNKEVYVASHTTTQKDILAELEKQTRGDDKNAKWQVEKVDGTKLFEEAHGRIQSGKFEVPDIYTVIQTIAFGQKFNGASDHSKKAWNGRLELANEDFAGDIKAVLKKH